VNLLREYIKEHLVIERVYKPVYRATNAPGVKTGRHGTSILYWADDPRPADFGKHVTKAKIRLKDPYMGTSIEAYNVVALMRDDEVIKILKDIDYEYDSDMYDDYDPSEQLVGVLEDQHHDGIWQRAALINAIKGAGYDGIISTDPHGGRTEYVTFSPEQYKILDSWIDEERTGERR
jgi:hypothetical protein